MQSKLGIDTQRVEKWIMKFVLELIRD